MDKQISFKQLETSDSSISVTAQYDGTEQRLEFSFSQPVDVPVDNIALALSTLCGQKFDSVYFDFGVKAEILAGIANFAQAEVGAYASLAEVSENNSTAPRSGNVLSFSGGFDSMAALALMPDDTHLVSLDFGGWFEREAEFFKRFSPLIVTTNVRRVPTQRDSLVRNHWGFMGIGAILTSAHLDAKYHTFGSILGRSFLQETPKAPTLPQLQLAGLKDATYSNGLTEVGTAKIMLQAYPDLVADSLTSLAGKNDKKRFLKMVITHLVEEEVKSGADLPLVPQTWSKPIPFKESHAEAMGGLYAMWKGKSKLVAPLFEGIPAEAKKLAASTDLTFMEELNFDHCQTLPYELWPDFAAKLARFGFRAYSEKDWQAASKTREYLREVFR